MSDVNETTQAVRRVEDQLVEIHKLLVEIHKLSERASRFEHWIAWLKGAWIVLAALYAYLSARLKRSAQLWTTVLIVPVVLAVSACGAIRYTVHPWALNTMDSVAFDALLVSETAIEQARADVEAGQLPDSAKLPLSKLIATYNLARQSWLTYRGALTTHVPAEGYLEELNRNLMSLTNALREFKEAVWIT